MFPGQQCATCPAQIWPPRLGIKLLEGAPSTEKWRKGVYFRMASQKIGAISLVFAQWVERAQSGHINPATPVVPQTPPARSSPPVCARGVCGVSHTRVPCGTAYRYTHHRRTTQKVRAYCFRVFSRSLISTNRVAMPLTSATLDHDTDTSSHEPHKCACQQPTKPMHLTFV